MTSLTLLATNENHLNGLSVIAALKTPQNCCKSVHPIRPVALSQHLLQLRAQPAADLHVVFTLNMETWCSGNRLTKEIQVNHESIGKYYSNCFQCDFLTTDPIALVV